MRKVHVSNLIEGLLETYIRIKYNLHLRAMMLLYVILLFVRTELLLNIPSQGAVFIKGTKEFYS